MVYQDIEKPRIRKANDYIVNGRRLRNWEIYSLLDVLLIAGYAFVFGCVIAF